MGCIFFQMLQSIVFHRVRLTKFCFKDLHLLSRTFADLPNIRGDAQQPNSPTRPAKPPDFSPVQQNGFFLKTYSWPTLVVE